MVACKWIDEERVPLHAGSGHIVDLFEPDIPTPTSSSAGAGR